MPLYAVPTPSELHTFQSRAQRKTGSVNPVCEVKQKSLAVDGPRLGSLAGPSGSSHLFCPLTT